MDEQRRESDDQVSRRSFLYGTGLLAGYAFSAKQGLAQNVKKPDTSKYQSTTITTHEFYGDIDERLDFPKDWQIETVKMAGHDAPVLSAADIRKSILSPIETPPLSEIAAGKKTAVITFDDLTRPTPVDKVAPYVVEELNKAGIDDDHILFLGSFGNHCPLTQSDARGKLGAMVDRCCWMNHNVWDNNVLVGRTSQGNYVEINNYFLKADVRITISGLKVHGSAGYGGGAKAILPGVASFKTIYYNHGVVAGYSGGTSSIGGRNSTLGQGKVTNNDMRRDMEEAARFAGVNYSVQIVYNGKREPVAVFCGDIKTAHYQACEYANSHYVCTPVRGADVVICNSYPQIQQANLNTGFLNSSLNQGGSSVLVMQNPMGICPLHYLELNREYKMASYWDTYPMSRGGRGGGGGQMIIFSQYIQKRDLVKFSPNAKVARNWTEDLGYLEPAHKSGAKVVVYPYCGIQHSAVKLS